MRECSKCTGEILPMHAKAGHVLCVPCRDKRAAQVRASWCVAQLYSKGNYQLVTDLSDLTKTNPKRTI
jgi:hypothetical protein